MNRIARRSIALVLAVVLMFSGVVLFMVEYFIKGDT